MNSSGEGKTLIEALEGNIGRDHSADFGIVLMTPDDMGYSKDESHERAEPRARQNVVLETGMLLSSLTRERMAIVVKGYLKLPSDLEGIIRFGYNEHVGKSFRSSACGSARSVSTCPPNRSLLRHSKESSLLLRRRRESPQMCVIALPVESTRRPGSDKRSPRGGTAASRSGIG
jgi:predicted nucleotide-binding protein with TIR-like domain